MNNEDYLISLYKPYRITRLNKVLLFYCSDGTYAIKNTTTDYHKLYNYLYSRSFTYLPKLVDNLRNDTAIFEYQENIRLNDYQTSEDLINLVSLLHSKTSYFKEITPDTYKEIYENIQNKILFLQKYYNNLFDLFIEEQNPSPSHYLLLRNFTVFKDSLENSSFLLEKWYTKAKEETKTRVSLVHNNLRLSHLIKNDQDYLISFDQYTFDTPVLDLYRFYQNEWENISFSHLLDLYNDSFRLTENEENLLFTLLVIPNEINFENSEIEICRLIRKEINYLNKSFQIINKATTT